MRPRHLAVLVLPLALTACGADSATPPPFTPTTAASSPSSSATVQPESAEEFIRRWEAAGDTMQANGDTGPFKLLSDKGCESCTAFADSVERIYAHGGYIHYEGTTIRWIKRREPGVYDVRVSSGPTEYRESTTGPIKHFTGGTVTMQLRLERRGKQWLVLDSSQLAGSAA